MTADVRVKLCGLSGAADAVAAAAAGADFLGFVLAQSRRQVTAQEVALALAAVRRAQPQRERAGGDGGPRIGWAAESGSRPERVGGGAAQPVLVMVDPTFDEAQSALEVSGARHIQLAGDEPPELCGQLRERVGCTVWKAWGVRGAEEDGRLADYLDVVDAVVFDRHVGSARGGTGAVFDWRALDCLWPLLGSVPAIVAGGLTPDNVADLLCKRLPFAVDVSSGIETDGRKDPVKMQLFAQRVRSFRADQSNQKQGSVTDVSG